MTTTTDTAAAPITRRTRISLRKLANVGDDYRAEWAGLLVVFTTFEGDRLIGTLAWNDANLYPIVRFDDGRWARLDLDVEIVVGWPTPADLEAGQ